MLIDLMIDYLWDSMLMLMKYFAGNVCSVCIGWQLYVFCEKLSRWHYAIVVHRIIITFVQMKH